LIRLTAIPDAQHELGMGTAPPELLNGAGERKAFCACPHDSCNVYGICTLSIRSEDAELLLGDERVPERHFPAIYLGTLAVARHYQRSGLGTILLMNALQRCYYIAQNVAVFGVALRSLNDKTSKLYGKYGFGLRETCQQPLMVGRSTT
jgi:ribosomal protein S18 acetylase RimI-like enzyme